MSFYEVNGICQTLFSFEKVETPTQTLNAYIEIAIMKE